MKTHAMEGFTGDVCTLTVKGRVFTGRLYGKLERVAEADRCGHLRESCEINEACLREVRELPAGFSDEDSHAETVARRRVTG